MKNIYTLLLLSFAGICNAQYTWLNKPVFQGTSRYKAEGFVINSKAYIVGGRTSTSPLTYTNTVWEYEPLSNTQIQKNNFPFAVVQPVTFAVGNKGYVVGGGNSSNVYQNTNYEYDPANDSWTSKANFPESGVGASFGFSYNGKGYVISGDRNTSSPAVSVYEYNPTTNQWTQKADFPGTGRKNLQGFVIGNYAYAGLGTVGNGVLFDDWYRYDIVNNTWSSIASFPGKERCCGMAFELNGKGYAGGGLTHIANNYYVLSDFYEYDPSGNTWTAVPGLPGAPRQHSAAFVVGGSGYIVGGYDDDAVSYYNLISQFTTCGTATEITVLSDDNNNEFLVYPNPTDGLINIEYSSGKIFDVSVFDLQGRLIVEKKDQNTSANLSIQGLVSGTYMIRLIDKVSLTEISKRVVLQ